MPHQRTASQEEWLEAQRDHLKTEKALTRMRDLVAAKRRALPWLAIDKDYVFDTPQGEERLAGLFGSNSQLIVHHLMFHPDWDEACVGCSFQADHIDGPRQHLENHDLSIVAVSRAPLDKIEAYRRRMGWNFRWVSSGRSDFNFDFRVTFRPEEVAAGKVEYNFGTITIDPRYVDEELPGISVFVREGDDIFLTQSIYARGLDLLIGANHYLDIAPKGRNEAQDPNWVRRHDDYGGAAAPCHAAAS